MKDNCFFFFVINSVLSSNIVLRNDLDLMTILSRWNNFDRNNFLLNILKHIFMQLREGAHAP